MQHFLQDSRPRILVVDDNPAIHEDLRKIFAFASARSECVETTTAFLGSPSVQTSDYQYSANVELDSAYQGEEAVELVASSVHEAKPYSIAFCDMRMQGELDGLATIEKIWEIDPEIQIVFCSAFSDVTWSEITRRIGYSDQLLILKKPFDSSEVLQLAFAMIQKRSAMVAAAANQKKLETITEHQNLDLMAAHRETDMLFKAINSIVIGLDAFGIVKRWNEKAVLDLEISADQAVGKLLKELPINWANPDFPNQLTKNRMQLARMETNLIAEGELQKIIGFSTYPVFDDKRVFQGTLILGKDLSDERAKEQQLYRAQKLESVGQLAAGVAHEINTPLQFIGDNLDYLNTKFGKLIPFLKATSKFLQTDDEDLAAKQELRQQVEKLKLAKLFENVPEALDDSIEGVQHVSRIVRAMKELSHPGGEEKKEIDINRILESSKTVSTNEWKYVADFELDLGPDLPRIQGFSGELNQVILNLIVNAAHAIGERIERKEIKRGAISLRSRFKDGCIIIELEDTGGGIPISIRNKVFDPFFTTKAVGKGTGQGLALAHAAIVKQHQGAISFDVVDGTGTTFIIKLPVTAQAAAEISTPIETEILAV